MRTRASKALPATSAIILASSASFVAGCFPDNVTAPEEVPVTAFVKVAVGVEHTCAIDAQSRALCWGENLSSQLGVGDRERRLVPAIVAGGRSFTDIAAGGAHSCGIATDGRTYCWGDSLFGQTGDGNTGLTFAPTPRRTAGDHTFVMLSAGDAHTCGLTPGGSVWCWGLDFDGRLGLGATTDILSAVPDSVLTDERFVAVTAGERHTCALSLSGEAWCWGFGENGQLGTGDSPTLSFVPVRVTGGHTFVSLDAGRAHTCGVTPAGELYCWGAGAAGQIGDGQEQDRAGPVLIGGAETFTSVAAGGDNTCAIATDGRLFCWGRTVLASVGDNTLENRLVPEIVLGAVTSFSAVWSGDRPDGATSCGLGPSDILYCWGWGRTGQIGNGTILDQAEPTRVAGQS